MVFTAITLTFFNFVPNSGVRKFCHRTTTVAKCDKRATVDGLSLTILGDGERGKVLSTVDRRLSPVDHTRRSSVSITARWAIVRDGARRAGPSASAETCSFIREYRDISFEVPRDGTVHSEAARARRTSDCASVKQARATTRRCDVCVCV